MGIRRAVLVAIPLALACGEGSECPPCPGTLLCVDGRCLAAERRDASPADGATAVISPDDATIDGAREDASLSEDTGTAPDTGSAQDGGPPQDSGTAQDAALGDAAIDGGVDAAMPADAGTFALTVWTTGNAAPLARHSAECVATGDRCLVIGNRDLTSPRRSECVLPCPAGSAIAICCSLGSDPCAAEDVVSRDGFEEYDSEGIVVSCTVRQEVARCSAVMPARNARVDCGFSD